MYIYIVSFSTAIEELLLDRLQKMFRTKFLTGHYHGANARMNPWHLGSKVPRCRRGTAYYTALVSHAMQYCNRRIPLYRSISGGSEGPELPRLWTRLLSRAYASPEWNANLAQRRAPLDAFNRAREEISNTYIICIGYNSNIFIQRW